MEKLDTTILVAAEHLRDGNEWSLTGLSSDILQLARQVTTGPVIAVVGTPKPDLEAIGSVGVDVVNLSASYQSYRRNPAAVADAISDCISQLGDDQEIGAIFMPSTYLGKQASGHLAAKLGTGVAVDVTGVSIVDGRIIATKNVLGGGWETNFELDPSNIPVLAISRVNIENCSSSNSSPEINNSEVSFSIEAKAVQLLSSERRVDDASGNLADSEVVVVGGRGVDGDFDLARSLAFEIDGAVGATRVACDEGWVDRSLQIGQTGLSISPNLYVGLGVSGAIHHTCGMQGSEKIVAVCDDPDAPIFELADFGVIGDVQDVVPQAIEELKRLKSE